MRPFYLLGVLAMVVLTECGNPKVNQDKFNTFQYNNLVADVRNAQAALNDYVRKLADDCKKKNQILVRDSDGILVCIDAPKKTEEKQ